jgi:FAD/FMN-containing dehydrogenase
LQFRDSVPDKKYRVELVWQNSTCFFKPQTTADVAFGMKIVTTIGSKFATRSGGHSQNPGWNSITNGVLFDLSVLNGTSISADHSYATIGTGQRWGTTYDYLDQFNKAAVGGRSFDVGVGGLIIGGKKPESHCFELVLIAPPQSVFPFSRRLMVSPVTMSNAFRLFFPTLLL